MYVTNFFLLVTEPLATQPEKTVKTNADRIKPPPSIKVFHFFSFQLLVYFKWFKSFDSHRYVLLQFQSCWFCFFDSKSEFVNIKDDKLCAFFSQVTLHICYEWIVVLLFLLVLFLETYSYSYSTFMFI